MLRERKESEGKEYQRKRPTRNPDPRKERSRSNGTMVREQEMKQAEKEKERAKEREERGKKNAKRGDAKNIAGMEMVVTGGKNKAGNDRKGQPEQGRRGELHRTNG